MRALPVSRRMAAWALLGAALAAGCGPTSKRLRQELRQGAAGTYIAGVPFVAQRRERCGPAALASVARFYGLETTEEAIARQVYLPSIGGTLTVDLRRCARELGLWSWSGRGSADDVRTWLDRGVPMIALLRQGLLAGGGNHYVVVTGYHGGRGYFLAHVGHLPNRPISFRRFARRSREAGGWMLAACPPEAVRWPLSAEGHNRLGLLLERAGKLERALAEYRQAVAAGGRNAIFHFNRGNVLARLGRREEAEEAYRRAIALQPACADAHNNLASLLLDAGRLHEALHEARRAVAAGGVHTACYHDTLGRALLAHGDFEEAARAFRRAIADAAPDAPLATEARLGLIEALARGGHGAAAAAERDRLAATAADPALRRRAARPLE
ncbi:MAG: tetratricopeptide repeat protein [Candidatus Brocadiia bacterium]